MKIVAVGGGPRAYPPIEMPTEPIDAEIVRLSGVQHPRVLVIPTASEDRQEWRDLVRGRYESLGCSVDELLLCAENPSAETIAERILTANIIYVTGGNTPKMLEIWRARGVDALLRKAGESGAVLAGTSAGAICWFTYGMSDSGVYPAITYKKIDALGFYPFLFCPHYNDSGRVLGLPSILTGTNTVALGVQNYAAIEIYDDKYRIITNAESAGAFCVQEKNRELSTTPLPADGVWRPVRELL